MRLNLQHLSVRSTNALDSWVERQIFSLGELRQIDEAHIRLMRLADASPAYAVQVHLVTPGPDLQVEKRDHTLRAAFAKAMAQLRAQITSRTTQRLRRFKTNLKARRAG